MKVFCKEFITVWTRGLVRWLSQKFDSISIDLTPVAKQGTNPNATNTAILAAFGNINFSTLAKQGTDPTATNTVIRDLVLQQGILYAQEYAAAINEIAGDWSTNSTNNESES